MAEAKIIPTELMGKIRHDKKYYPDYVLIDGRMVKYWIWDRLASIPEGALVRINVEVIDDRPE